MGSEYAHWAERNKRNQAKDREYRLAKPRIVLVRFEGEPWWVCDTTETSGQRGHGKTPSEAYESWFNDSIPF